MANTTSGSYIFGKTLPVEEIIEEAYERIGMQGVSGYQLKTARRSLNILFSEWGNRGLHYWEVKNQSIKMVDGQAEYSLFRSTGDGTSAGITTTLSAGINATVTTIGVASVANLPNSGIIKINDEIINGECNKSYDLNEGDQIDILATKKSAYGYLAIEGGFDVKPFCNSVSILARAHIGPNNGDKIKIKDK